MPLNRQTWLRYAAPPLAVTLAMIVRLRLWPDVFVDATFMPQFMAVLFCAWLGGVGPGLLAGALALLASDYFLVPPLHSLIAGDARHQLQLILFAVFSVAIVTACESLHRERRRALTLRGDIHELETTQAQLRTLAANLSEAHRRKDEFLATLAHELRNPLAPIRNSLELLRLADDRLRRESARQTMERQLGHLVRLVDDLLDVSRITRDSLPLRREVVALDGVVRNVVESAQPQFTQMGHTLDIDLPETPVYLDADPVRIAQVLGNVLHNACKFTPAGGHVRLQATVDGDSVEITVSDNGIGVAPDLKDRVFEMFRQGDASLERSHGGLGIGLGLARRLVELHGGQIDLYSDGPGQGTQVRLRLPTVPLARSVATLPAEPLRPPAPVVPSARRVLVADDNTDAGDSMAVMLQLLGHEVRVARDGLEAIEAAEAFHPDLALLDIGMPGLNGYEVCRRLRQQPWARSMRIVAVTGWGDAKDRNLSRDAGFDEHLVKPLAPALLSRLLDAPPPDGGRPRA